jgi:hypothetical protein
VPDEGRVSLSSRTRVPRAHDPAGALRLNAAGRLLLSAVLLAPVALGAPAGAASHDGIVGVFVEPDHASPGGAIAVRGDNVSTDDPVRVDLIAEETRVTLGTTVTDGQGHFTVGAILPTDLPGGTYAIEVNSASGVQMTAFVQVEGAPIFDAQNGAPPGRDEGLPARPAATGQAARGAPTTADQATEAGSDIDFGPQIALLAAIGAFAMFVRWTRRPRSSRAESADLP